MSKRLPLIWPPFGSVTVASECYGEGLLEGSREELPERYGEGLQCKHCVDTYVRTCTCIDGEFYPVSPSPVSFPELPAIGTAIVLAAVW